MEKTRTNRISEHSQAKLNRYHQAYHSNRSTFMHWRSRLNTWFELSRGGDGVNVRPMEGLRGFAVFLVFLVHYTTFISPWIEGNPMLSAAAKKIHTIGNVGVDLFFVLSGFLIYGSLIGRRQNFLKFMSRRVRRIYPTFLIVFATYVVLSFVFPSENKIPSSRAAASIYLLQNFLLLPGIVRIEPMITVAWSLSYEMFYYLTIPFVLSLFGLRERSPGERVIMFIFSPSLTRLIAQYLAGIPD